MSTYPFTMDGKVYPGIRVMELRRSFKVLDTDLTERVQNGDIDRDVIGTFYNYSMKIDSDDSMPTDYDAFYEVISSPDESHDLVFPYGQGTLSLKAYVTGGDDNLLAMMPQQNRWGELTVNFIACSPQRRPA